MSNSVLAGWFVYARDSKTGKLSKVLILPALADNEYRQNQSPGSWEENQAHQW